MERVIYASYKNIIMRSPMFGTHMNTGSNRACAITRRERYDNRKDLNEQILLRGLFAVKHVNNTLAEYGFSNSETWGIRYSVFSLIVRSPRYKTVKYCIMKNIVLNKVRRFRNKIGNLFIGLYVFL